jgi:hypothetical protein
MSTPVALSEEQMLTVLAAAYPLSPDRRNAFLEDVARELAALPDIGDGALYRIVMAAQQRHYVPPERVGVGGVSKYNRKVSKAG